MFFSKPKVIGKSREVFDLELKVKSLEDRLAELKNEIKTQIENSSFEVDFKKLDAISIERGLGSKGSPVTTIGYLKSADKTMGEWVFTCSQDTHERLSEEFRKYRDESNG